MNRAIKGTGYAISMVSVGLLAVVAWPKASEQPILLTCLIAGSVLSMVGIGLRWLVYEREQRHK
jgi:hypothetical protein